VNYLDSSHCRDCAENYFGDRCHVYCNPESSCGNHGTCSLLGCTCFDTDLKGHFEGLSCSSCKEGWYGPLCAVHCESEWKFSSNGDQIVGVFHNPTPLWHIDCASLISSSIDLEKLGTGAICRWTDEKHTSGSFEITFGSSPTLLPDDKLELDLFLGSEATGILKRQITIRAPSNITAPTVVLNGHNKLGGCNSLQLDASLSTSTDRRGLSFVWELLSNHPNVTDLHVFLESQRGTRLVVASDLMQVGETYQFGLNVATFLGGNTSLVHQVIKSRDTIPLALVNGGLTRSGFSSDVVIFDGRIEEAPCLPASLVDFAWNQTRGVSLPFSTTSNGRRLILDGSAGEIPHTSAQYEFEFVTSLKDDSSLRSVSRVVFNVEAAPLVVRVPGGSKRQTRVNLNTTLAAEVEFYPTSGIDFSWMCTSVANAPCPNWNQITTNSSSLSIVAGELPIGLWKVTLTASRSLQIVTTTIELEVTAELIPRISFGEHPSLVNRNDRLILPSKLGLETPENTVSYSWKTLEGSRELSQSELASIAFTPLSNNILGLKANTLTEGSTYEFTITGLASDGATGYSVTHVKVNESPRPGTINIIPEVGEMLSTDFTVECTNWADSDTPLSYSLSYVDPTSQQENALVFRTSSNVFSTSIPVPGSQSANYTLTLVLYVSDRYGASTRLEKNATVFPLSSDPSKFALAVSTSFSNQEQKLETMTNREKFSTVTIFATAMNTGDEAMRNATRSIRGALFSLVNETLQINDGTSFTSDDIGQQVDMISKLSADTVGMSSGQRTISTGILRSSASSSQLSPNSANTLASGLSNLITSSLSQNSSTNSNSNSTKETKQFFDIAGDLIGNLVAQQIVGQVTSEINTPQLSLAALKKSVSDLESELSIGGSSIRIPPGVVLPSVLGEESGQGVGIKVVVSNFIPFENSENVSSTVISLTFTSDSGSDLNVEGLSNAIILDIPGTFNSSEYEFDLTKEGKRPMCRFWNTTTNTWDGEGGTFLALIHNNQTNTTYARCAFTHTTDFGAVVEHVLPSVNIPDVRLISQLNTDNMTALIVIGSFLMIYVVLMLSLEVLSCVRPLVVKKHASASEIRNALCEKRDSPARRIFDSFKQAHIWVAFLFPPTLGKTKFTRSIILTLIMVTTVGILVSNALTFGRTQANFAQVITAAIFSDMASTPFIIGFTILFGLVKRRKKNKKKDVPLLSPDELENPFGDDTLNEKVESFVEFQHKKNVKANDNPWHALDSKIERTVQYRTENPSLYTDDKNIHNVATPVVQALIVDEENEFRNVVEGQSLRLLFEKRFDILMDALDEAYYRFMLWEKSMRKSGGVSKLSLLIFAIASLAYFVLLGVVDYCVISTVTWLGERGAIIVTTLGIVSYIGGCILFYLYSKYKVTNVLSEKSKAKASSKAVMIVVSLSGVLISLSLAVMVMLAILYFGNRWEFLVLDYYIVLNVGAALIIVLSLCLSIFSLYMPKPKKSKKVKQKKVQKSKEPGILPWWSRYAIYLLAWIYILGFSFLIVVYGIQFDTVSKGSATNWIVGSFLGLGQNILLNKPVVFVAKTVVLTSIGTAFSEMASSGFEIDIGFDVDF